MPVLWVPKTEFHPALVHLPTADKRPVFAGFRRVIHKVRGFLDPLLAAELPLPLLLPPRLVMSSYDWE
jgi:hypothetical protein